MGGDKEKSPFLTISSLAIILGALGITIFTQNPFQSARPSVPELREPAKVSARLWQDPYQAVLDHLKTFTQLSSARKVCGFSLYTSSRTNRCAPVVEQDPLHIKERMVDGKVTVLGVMVSGNRFAEDMEQRIRYRYAVLSALRRLGFIPDDPEHVSYVAVASPSDLHPKIPSLASIMPYEWLRNFPGKESVLLIWINDDLFMGNRPLWSLNCLARWIGLPAESSEKRDITLKIIGPAWSDTLKEMLYEANDAKEGRFDALKDVWIYSAMATADNSLLLEGVRENQLLDDEAGGAVENIFRRKHKINFIRTIRTDRELAKMLVDELVRRNFRLGDCSDHILLVSEWDTFYGRSLNDIYKRILIEKKAPGVESRVWQISYLRGIDGTLPGEKEERKDEKSDAKTDNTEELRKLEEPTGKSQYDYLRRLTQETYHLSREMKASIKAVGILGTDFYDKLLVLQAFHERFPQAVFFTTDLDARFLQPDALKWTRNLIVVSNFDLALRKDEKRDLQGDVPPFRDNYQTSLFFSTLWAFSGEYYSNPVKDLLRQKVTRRIPEIVNPQLFEIGRYSAVKLSQDEDDIHPRRHNTTRIDKVLKSAIIITLILVALLFFISTRFNGLIKKILRSAKSHWFVTAGIPALIIGGCLLFYQFVVIDPNEEPLSIFEGVSVWPTECLRLLAALLAITFIILSRRRLMNNCKAIKGSFGLSQPGDAGLYTPMESGKHFFKRLNALRKKWKNYSFHWEVDRDAATMDDLWREYIRHDDFEHRVLRLLPIVILYIILCSTIIGFSELPIAPVRGVKSLMIDRAVILTTFISFTFLVFYVFDVIRNCRRFIDIAAELITDWEWSEELINRVTRENTIRPGPEIKEWVLIQLIASRTDEVGKLIFYPFIVWFIMFISRIRPIDNWHTPVGLAIVFTMGALFAWSCAFLLRQSAENARVDAIQRLKAQLASSLSQDKPDEGKMKRIAFVLEEVSDIRTGAFAPFMQHPLVRALFLPFGGVGGISLLEFLTKMN